MTDNPPPGGNRPTGDDGWSTPRKVPGKRPPAKKSPGPPAKDAPKKEAAAKLGPLPVVDPDDPLWRRLWTKNQRRRIRKKRRIAAMSRRRRILRRFGVIGTWALGLFTLLLVGLVALFYLLTNVPRPEDLALPQVVTIQYADGSTMARIGTEDRVVVPLDKVPDSLKWAVISTEDRNFYSEPGFSITATAKAAVSNLFGGDSRGGSGITQQYVKNAYLTSERTLSRKIKELMISVKLARQYSKDQILGYYLNTVYFGRGVWGVEAAAKSYFKKHVQDLTTAESAVLAGLLRDPGYYDPTDNPGPAKDRWLTVLNNMVVTHHLTQQQADQMTYPTDIQPPSSTKLGATGWRDLIVKRVLAELSANGISEDEMYNRGGFVRTTIDKKAQDAAVSAIHDVIKDNLTDKQKNLKDALVAVNPANGAVLAYYGGPGGEDGYDGKPDWNDYAGVGARPPGSSFKPYTLATVLEQTLQKAKGKPTITLGTRVDGSQCVKIEGRQICNDPSDAQYSSSSIRLADAIKYSLNTTFDLLAEQAGPTSVAKMAHRAGVAMTDGDGKPTLVGPNGKTGFGIGIGDYPVRTIDQAVGFATFANGGVRNPAYFVQQVKDSSGTVFYRHQSEKQKVMDPKIANDVTLALEPVAGFSGDSLADGRVSAAKTGTEGIYQDKQLRNSDAWMVGYTPQVSTAVWVGSGNSTEGIYSANGRNMYGREEPGQTWKRFMDTYLDGKPNLPMATTQQIWGGSDQSPPPTPTTKPETSSSEAPSTSETTSSAPPTTSSAPPPTTSAPRTTVVPPPITSVPLTTSAPPSTSSAPAGGCGGLLQPPCSSTPARTGATTGGP